MAVILIGGGARSGKSHKALELARERGSLIAFIATAQALDEGMRQRIDRHRAERGAAIVTVEEPLNLGHAIRACAPFDAVVIDCLTLWLSNVLLAARDAEHESNLLLEAASTSGATLIIVTNEVGCGIVPDNELAIRFRDEAGRLNQRVAGIAGEVYWMIFGCAVRVK